MMLSPLFKIKDDSGELNKNMKPEMIKSSIELRIIDSLLSKKYKQTNAPINAK